MELKDLMAISGHSGLFKFVSQGHNGIIVESLETGKRTHASAASKISALEDIAIFTETSEVQLSEVFNRIFDKEDGGETLNPKTATSEDMKTYFEDIIPDYDTSRVYVSDMKKVFKWYNELKMHDLLIPDKEEDKKEEAPAENSENAEKEAPKEESKKENSDKKE